MDQSIDASIPPVSGDSYYTDPALHQNKNNSVPFISDGEGDDNNYNNNENANVSPANAAAAAATADGENAENESPGSGESGSHKSPSPHYSTALSQMDQALLQLAPEARVQSNHLLSENATLRARVKSLTQELNDARDIFSRRGKYFLSRMSGSDCYKKVQTVDVKGLVPLRQLKKKGNASIETIQEPEMGCQTEESYLGAMPSFAEMNAAIIQQRLAEEDKRAARKSSSKKSKSDGSPTGGTGGATAAAAAGGVSSFTASTSAPKSIVAGAPPGGSEESTASAEEASAEPNEVQLAKAEILKLKAENASLQHNVQQLRATGNISPERQQEIQASHSASIQRIEDLYRALRDSISKVSAAEAQLSELRASSGGSPGTSSSVRRKQHGAGGEDSHHIRPVSYSKSSNTDRVLDIHASSIPNAAPTPSRDTENATSEYVIQLERTNESTRAQLTAALKQLEEQTSERQPPSSATSVVSEYDRALGGRRSVAVSTGVSIASRVEDLFSKYNCPYAVEVVEDLLKNKDAPLKVLELQQSASQRSMDAGAASAMSSALATEVEALRKELLVSHVAMDEMQYSLDLERRSGAGATVVANESAARDIAILCDTVHASKAEIINLRNQLKEVTRERNIAVSDFTQLQDHFKSALVTGERLVESHQVASDDAYSTLTRRVHDLGDENRKLKSDLQASGRDLDKMKKSRDTSQREVLVLRERVSQMQSSIAQLRSEHTAQAQEIRALRCGGGSSGNATAGNASNSNKSRAISPGVSNRGKTPTNHRGGNVGRETSTSSGSGARKRPGQTSNANANVNFGQGELEAQYEELRGCFLELANLIPGDAQTARQVTEKLIREFKSLQQRVAQLEKDMRKRMAHMESAKKSVEEAKTRQLTAEQRARTLQTAAKRAKHDKKSAEEAAKVFDENIDTMNMSREDLETKIDVLEDELEATREQLLSTRNEVEVGRKLMLQLINDEDADLATLVNSAESKLGSSSMSPQHGGSLNNNNSNISSSAAAA